MTASYRLYGALGSPYSMKMRAVLRYRRLPHCWVTGRVAQEVAGTKVKVPVIPVLEYPDGSFRNDSTPLIYDLEARHPGDRSVVPEDAGDAFLAYLIEDFADEWVTKAMFHYRWFRPRDQEQMSRWLSFDGQKGGGLKNIEGFAAFFKDRQVGRMPLVGCTAENLPLIEASTRKVLGALEAHVVDAHCLFGSRPSLAEFSLFGQISQLGVDPTPTDMMRADYPYTWRWLAHVDDMSGIEGEWNADSAPVPQVVRGLLEVIGGVYLPFLAANAKAVASDANEVSLSAMGHTYWQAPFKYQVKCLNELRAAHQRLPQASAARIAPVLEETGCLGILKG